MARGQCKAQKDRLLYFSLVAAYPLIFMFLKIYQNYPSLFYPGWLELRHWRETLSLQAGSPVQQRVTAKQLLCVCQEREWELHPGQGQRVRVGGRGAGHRGDGGGEILLGQLPAPLLLRDRLAKEGGKVQGTQELHRLPADSQCRIMIYWAVF